MLLLRTLTNFKEILEMWTEAVAGSGSDLRQEDQDDGQAMPGINIGWSSKMLADNFARKYYWQTR